MSKVGITTRVDPDTKARLSRKLKREYEDKSMAEFLREKIDEEIAGEPDPQTDGYVPQNDQQADLYRSMLDHANRDLIVLLRRHGGSIAQDTGIAKDSLNGSLIELRRNGYVSVRSGMPGPGSSRNVAFKIKPLEADPEIWVHREVLSV